MQVDWVLLFLFPLCLFRIRGSGKGEEPSGRIVRLIQIRLTTSSFEEISLGCQAHFYLGHFTYRRLPAPVEPSNIDEGRCGGEAGAGIEPANSGFADRDLTTWLPRQLARADNIVVAARVSSAEHRDKSVRSGERLLDAASSL